jgi:class 3 adenylate cyclase
VLRKLLRLGITERTSPRGAKHLALTNAVTLLTVVQAVVLAALALAEGLELAAAAIAASLLALLAVFVLNALRRPGAARTTLATTAMATIVGCGAILGPAARVENYFFVAVAGAWFVWPRARHAALATFCYFTGYLALQLIYAWATPLDPLPPELEPVVRTAVSIAILLGLLGFAAWGHWQTWVTDRLLQRERARAERLLRNVLPAKIAERLKSGEARVIADRLPSATVLFADIAGFTPFAARVGPEKLVEILDEIFSAFDELATRHGVEKIKTIGDAYMAAAGVPEPCADHAARAAELALAMRAAVARFAAERGLDLRVRIGLCSGPVVAGVIGRHKFAYDLWGDTVNTAARMESHGLESEIQVEESTRLLLQDAYALRERGTIDVKGKGPMPTWLLDGPRAREESAAAAR